MRAGGCAMSPAKRSPCDATSTQQLIVAPRTRRFAGPYWGALVLLVPASIGLAIAVSHLSRMERALADEGAHASRVLVYALSNGQKLEVPIEPGTDVLRIVAHAMTMNRALSPEPHVAHLVLSYEDRGTEKREAIDL